jgi:anti-anti-sigma factor
MVFSWAVFFRVAGPMARPDARENDMTAMSSREPPGNARRTIVRLSGALDLAAAPALRERLIDVLHRGTGLLVLDLSQVLSCDASGLAVLIGTQRRARLLGTVMRLAAPSLPVTKLLRSTGLDRSFAIYPDLSGALASELDEPARPASAPSVPAAAGQRRPLVPELAAG